MSEVLWLSGDDIARIGVCEIDKSTEIVEKIFRLFDQKQAFIVEETALRFGDDNSDRACYALPAYVGGCFDVCGIKWTSHGDTVNLGEAVRSRIQATIVLNSAKGGKPLAIMNGTEIGATRTGAVTAAALKRLAPENAKRALICGAGDQAERQLQALLYAEPGLETVDIWSRGGKRNVELAERYQGITSVEIHAAADLDAAADGADIIIGATSASEPYLTERHFRTAALYCHIGFHEITEAAIEQFDRIVVDTWEEAKHVSGQSLFRYYRNGSFDEGRISCTFGELVNGRTTCPRATREEKIMFDAFGLPVFDIGLAKEAYIRAKEKKIGIELAW